MALATFIRRHSLLVYFSLAFAITWGGLLAVGAPYGVPGHDIPLEAIGLAFLTMIAGPSLSSLALTAVIDGRDGLQLLFVRMRRWRVGLRWYALAVLTTPLVALTVLLLLTGAVSPVFAPGLTAAGLVIGLIAGFFEEIGWTGFALPRLLRRHGVLVAGLMLGAVWGVWHGMADFWGRAESFGALWLPVFLTFVASVTAYRVLMAWVYERTQSILLAQLMHACYTGSLATFGPILSPAGEVLWNVIVAIVLWLIVAIFALMRRGERARRGELRQSPSIAPSSPGSTRRSG